MTHRIDILFLALLLTGTVNSAWAAGIHNPAANYFSFTDSPFDTVDFTSGFFFLEDFEDGLLNTPGVTKIGGSILLRNDVFSDSVDFDDGFIDNNGNTGGATVGALYSLGAFSLEFNFNAALLGGTLPTHVGLVVTDALTSTNMTLSGFRGGNLLGSITGFQVSELQHFTQEDRFYGFVDLNGIDRMVIAAATDNDWAMDHLQYGAVATPPPDHFQCYKAVNVAPNFERRSVTLADQFETKETTVIKPDCLCNPAVKSEDPENPGVFPDDLSDPTAHLACYKIKDQRGQPRFERRNVLVTDQFGELTLTVKRPEKLCVPSEKDLVPSDLNLDHFKCYAVETAIGTPKFVPREVALEDQFGQRTVTVVKPEALCNPVAKTVGGEETPIRNPDDHLTCYKIMPRNFSNRPAVIVNNQFGEGSLRVVSRKTLCVPASKTPLGD